MSRASRLEGPGTQSGTAVHDLSVETWAASPVQNRDVAPWHVDCLSITLSHVFHYRRTLYSVTCSELQVLELQMYARCSAISSASEVRPYGAIQICLLLLCQRCYKLNLTDRGRYVTFTTNTDTYCQPKNRRVRLQKYVTKIQFCLSMI